MAGIPHSRRWLFWDVEADALSPERDADYIIPRVLEKGRLEDVRWLVQVYGLPRIHTFLLEVGHPDLSKKTLTFWRHVLGAEKESWKSPCLQPESG